MLKLFKLLFFIKKLIHSCDDKVFSIFKLSESCSQNELTQPQKDLIPKMDEFRIHKIKPLKIKISQMNTASISQVNSEDLDSQSKIPKKIVLHYCSSSNSPFSTPNHKEVNHNQNQNAKKEEMQTVKLPNLNGDKGKPGQ